MKNFYLSFVVFLLIGGLFGKAFAQGGANIVNSFGRLQVKNAHVCAENGTQISLGGVSMFWSGWSTKYYNANTVNYLVDNMKSSIVRAAYGVPTHVDPPGLPGPQGNVQDVRNIIEAAIARGIYVIIDWHSEGDLTPYKQQAKSFFSDMIRDYGQYNNVMYEVWNEPTNSPTSTIQAYCQELTNHIRSEEAKYGHTSKLIICGSQTWSQYPNSYTINDPGKNVAFTFHGYFDNEPSHLTQLQNNVKAAMDMGNAVFVTEYGAKFCENTNTSTAIKWCQDNGISMCAWSANDKVEAWSIFTNNLDGLTCVGNYYKSKLLSWPTPVVTKIYPTSVSISPANATILTLGGTTQLSKSFVPANTTETNTTWSSSNTAIATVNAAGVVTAIGVGSATITATSKDKDGKNITGISNITVKNLVNIALNKPVTVSSVETGATVSVIGSNAVDGNASTRWSSVANDPQSLQVDLGASYTISSISINWEVASAKEYTIQTSSNGTNWTTIATQTNMATGARIDNLAINGTCRYIKINGTARTSIYGFSIYEFEVYGTLGTAIPPTSVSITPTTTSIFTGSTTTLIANVLPTNATDLTVSWSSSNTAVATVNTGGIVTGITPGTAVITATTTDGSLKATSTITVLNVPCTGININPGTLSMIKGTTSQLLATILPTNATNKSVTYTSSNTAIVTVSGTGLINAINTGSAYITATSADGKCYATCAVDVSNAPSFSLKIEAESYNLKSTAPKSEACSEGGLNMGWIGTGDWMKYAVNIPSTGVYTVNFRVSSPNNNTQVRLDTNAGAIVFGSTIIPNTSGWQNWQTVSVQMSLNGGSYDLGINALTGGFNINWIEIIGGSTTPVNTTGISMAPTTSLGVGASSTLIPTVTPNNASNKNINWTSNNTAVATVSNNGVVTGIAVGSANITATTQDGSFKATCTITVTPSDCPTWQANTNYTIGTVVVFNNQNYTSNNSWNSSAGDPFTATHSQSGWGWVIGGKCTASSISSGSTKTYSPSATTNSKISRIFAYPNPAKNNIVTLSGSDFQIHETISIQIYNLTGLVVYSNQILIDDSGAFNLPIASTENLKSGTYIIKVEGNEVKSTKLIIN